MEQNYYQKYLKYKKKYLALKMKGGEKINQFNTKSNPTGKIINIGDLIVYDMPTQGGLGLKPNIIQYLAYVTKIDNTNPSVAIKITGINLEELYIKDTYTIDEITNAIKKKSGIFLLIKDIIRVYTKNNKLYTISQQYTISASPPPSPK
jgi:hypothetical protein